MMLGQFDTKTINIWLDVAYTIAAKSKDPKQQVGAVLISAEGEFIQACYNGFAPDFPDLLEFWQHETLKHLFVIHAEENVLLRTCSAHCKGASMFVSKVPCVPCRVKAQAKGISHIYYRAIEEEAVKLKTWHRNQLEAIELMDRHGKVMLHAV